MEREEEQEKEGARKRKQRRASRGWEGPSSRERERAARVDQAARDLAGQLIVLC